MSGCLVLQHQHETMQVDAHFRFFTILNPSYTYSIQVFQYIHTSTPFNKGLNSGQINALPAYAASMCIQIFSSLPGTNKKQRDYEHM